MSRVLVTGSTTGLGKATAAALVDDGHHVVVHARNTQRARDVDDLVARGAGHRRRRPVDPNRRGEHRRPGQLSRIAGCRRPQRRRLRRPGTGRHARRACPGAGRQRAGAVPADCAHRPAGPSRLPEQWHAPRRRPVAARPRLAATPLERCPGVLRQQAVRHHPHGRDRSALARRARQRRRPRLGPDPHGWPRRLRRPHPRPRHPGLARRQRRTRRHQHRSLLVPPTTPSDRLPPSTTSTSNRRCWTSSPN